MKECDVRRRNFFKQILSRLWQPSASVLALVWLVAKNRSLFVQMTRRNIEMRHRGSALGLVP